MGVSRGFRLGYVAQKEWGGLMASAFFLEGVGGGLFLVSLLFGLRIGQLLGWLIIALAVNGVLIADLSRPLLAWRSFLKPRRSWISRGAISLIGFIILGALHLGPQYLTALPWSTQPGGGRVIMVMAALAAFWVVVYGGFVMSYPASIPLWNSGLVPVLFVLYGLLGGLGIISLLLPALDLAAIDTRVLASGVLGLTALTMVIIFSYLATAFSSVIAARESVRLLVKGRLSLSFLGGTLVVGLLAPLVLSASHLVGGVAGTSAALPMLGICILVGSYLFRYCLLRAGLYAPVL